jgi:cysteine desulfurase
MQNKTYLDHNATTPISEEVKALIPSWLELWGNPSSIHWAGRWIKSGIREARKNLTDALGGVSPLEIVFTSGGSEANNLVVRGIYDSIQNTNSESTNSAHFITTAVEHPSVIKPFQWIQKKSSPQSVDFLKVDRRGCLDLQEYKNRLRPGQTKLVSVMAANNETGSLFPIQEMAKIAHEAGALFHTDAVQYFGKLPLKLTEWDVDFASLSAHKFHALKGCGVLYCKKGKSIFEPQILGGSQERHRRGGTENTLGILSFGEVSKKLSSVSRQAEKTAKLRDLLETRVLTEIKDSRLTGHQGFGRLPNTSSFVIDGIDGETLLMSLDVKGFAVSTGAACSSGSPEPSPTLLAMGLTRTEAQSSLRVSLGWENTSSEIESFIETLIKIVTHLRALKNTDKNTDSQYSERPKAQCQL